MLKAAAGLSLGLIFFFNLLFQCFGALQNGFYRGKCAHFDVEDIVGGVVAARSKRDPTTSAALLHMLFHDCFVKGCDASVLLDGSDSEKTAFASRSLRDYDLIDDAKAAVEAVCPGVVSCADILVMATRDAVFASGGKEFKIKTGRRDGLVSLAKNVILPPPTVSMADAVRMFAAKGLDVTDLVYLLGAHTVGVTHCAVVKGRLYNFTGTGRPDPSMDPSLLTSLKLRCPQNGTVDKTIKLDQGFQSSTVFDKSYYQQILKKRGVVPFDQVLASHPLTRARVKTVAAGFDFTTRFGKALGKMSEIEVLTGKQGEIRKSCRVKNDHS